MQIKISLSYWSAPVTFPGPARRALLRYWIRVRGSRNDGIKTRDQFIQQQAVTPKT